MKNTRFKTYFIQTDVSPLSLSTLYAVHRDNKNSEEPFLQKTKENKKVDWKGASQSINEPTNAAAAGGGRGAIAKWAVCNDPHALQCALCIPPAWRGTAAHVFLPYYIAWYSH